MYLITYSFFHHSAGLGQIDCCRIRPDTELLGHSAGFIEVNREGKILRSGPVRKVIPEHFPINPSRKNDTDNPEVKARAFM